MVFVAAAFGVTLRAWLQAVGTPRARDWWARFLAMVIFLLLAQVATNVEQFAAEGSSTRNWLNSLEHVLMVVAGLWALGIAVRGLVEAYERRATVDEEDL